MGNFGPNGIPWHSATSGVVFFSSKEDTETLSYVFFCCNHLEKTSIPFGIGHFLKLRITISQMDKNMTVHYQSGSYTGCPKNVKRFGKE